MLRPAIGPDSVDTRERWCHATGVQRDLRLTRAQVQKLDALFEHGLAQRLTLHQKIDDMDRLLERVPERGNGDDASVERLSGQVEALRAQANVRRTVMRFAMYRTLTREQRDAFARMRRTTPAGAPRLVECPT